MAGLHGGLSGGRGGGGMAALMTEDFQEDEVWAMMKARESSNSNSKTRKGPSSSSSPAWRFTATPRAIPRSGGGGVQEFPGAARVPQRRSTAPLNIPDWSKILKKQPKRNLWDDACDAYTDDDDGGRKFSHLKIDDNDDEDDDMLPPHEYLARRLAGTQIASFSMCEGIGRTLKGRDLSNLRNAILTKTGFLE